MTVEWPQGEIEMFSHSQGSSWSVVSLPFQQHLFHSFIQIPAIMSNPKGFECYNAELELSIYMQGIATERFYAKKWKLCESCIREISLGKPRSRLCSQKELAAKNFISVLLSLFRQKGIKRLNRSLGVGRRDQRWMILLRQTILQFR